GSVALCDVAPDLWRVDIASGAGEIDARAPGFERGQKRQLSQVPAIGLCRGARELPGLSVRGTGNPAGDGKTRSKALYIPFERGRQRFVEIVDVEDWGPLGCRIGAEIRQMAVTAGLHTQSGGRTRREVGRHDCRGAAQKSEWIGLHPRVPDRKQFRDPGLALADQNFDRIRTIRGHLPFGLRAGRPLPTPFGTLGASFVEPLARISVFRGSVHDSPRIRSTFPQVPRGCEAVAPLRLARSAVQPGDIVSGGGQRSAYCGSRT